MTDISFLSTLVPQQMQQRCTTATTCYLMEHIAWPRPLQGWIPPPFITVWPLASAAPLHLLALGLQPRLLRPAVWLQELLTPPTSAHAAPQPSDQKPGEKSHHHSRCHFRTWLLLWIPVWSDLPLGPSLTRSFLVAPDQQQEALPLPQSHGGAFCLLQHLLGWQTCSLLRFFQLEFKSGRSGFSSSGRHHPTSTRHPSRHRQAGRVRGQERPEV